MFQKPATGARKKSTRKFRRAVNRSRQQLPPATPPSSATRGCPRQVVRPLFKPKRVYSSFECPACTRSETPFFPERRLRPHEIIDRLARGWHGRGPSSSRRRAGKASLKAGSRLQRHPHPHLARPGGKTEFPIDMPHDVPTSASAVHRPRSVVTDRTSGQRGREMPPSPSSSTTGAANPPSRRSCASSPQAERSAPRPCWPGCGIRARQIRGCAPRGATRRKTRPPGGRAPRNIIPPRRRGPRSGNINASGDEGAPDASSLFSGVPAKGDVQRLSQTELPKKKCPPPQGQVPLSCRPYPLFRGKKPPSTRGGPTWSFRAFGVVLTRSHRGSRPFQRGGAKIVSTKPSPSPVVISSRLFLPFYSLFSLFVLPGLAATPYGPCFFFLFSLPDAPSRITTLRPAQGGPPASIRRPTPILAFFP